MTVLFRDAAQWHRYEALSRRPIALTTFAHGPTMTALGIGASIDYMFNQIGWEGFANKKHKTYHRLTLEFLSSLSYNPTCGKGYTRGRITFRLFGYPCHFNIREMAELLGFPDGPAVFSMVQEDLLMEDELSHFWSSISGHPYHDLRPMLSTDIHNPTIRYFHMILAYTLFGKAESDNNVSRDELFIMFCVFQSRPVNGATFMFDILCRISRADYGPILIGGLVTKIADAMGFRTRLSQINPLGEFCPMNITFCFNRGMIRDLGPHHFQLLINNEVVPHFT